MPPGEAQLVTVVPVGVALFALLGSLLFFSVVSVASVLAAEPPGGEVPVPHKPQKISSRPLLWDPVMAMR